MNNLKISGGKLKRSNLKVPKSAKPVKAIIKQSVFNTLSEEIENKVVADLFAGSGNLAFESLSRGAKYAVLVEDNYDAVKNIQENIVNLNLENKAEVEKLDVLKFIGGSPEQFEIVFADPPYSAAKKHFLKTVHLIIKKGGYLIYFYNKSEEDLEVSSMEQIKTQCFGKNCYTIYKTA